MTEPVHDGRAPAPRGNGGLTHRRLDAATETRLLWAVLIVGLGGVLGTFAVTRLPVPVPGSWTARRSALPVYGQVADFSLTDQLGRPVTRRDFDGRPWVADFIFTHCAGPCPVLTANLARLAHDADVPSPVRFASFSIDPEEDSPAVLKAYAESFGADASRWRFMTGERRSIADLARNSFHLTVEMSDPQPAGTGAPDSIASPAAGDAAAAPADSARLYDIPHTLRFTLVDADGRIRGYYDGTDQDEIARLKRDIRALPDRTS